LASEAWRRSEPQAAVGSSRLVPVVRRIAANWSRRVVAANRSLSKRTFVDLLNGERQTTGVSVKVARMQAFAGSVAIEARA